MSSNHQTNMTWTNFFWIAFHEKIYNHLPQQVLTSVHHLRQEVSASNSLLIPQSSTPLRSSVRQPLFFLFFCRSVRSRSHARSDKASNLSGPKIYSNLPYPNALTLMLLPGHQSKNKEKYKRIFKSMMEMLQIFKSSNHRNLVLPPTTLLFFGHLDPLLGYFSPHWVLQTGPEVASYCPAWMVFTGGYMLKKGNSQVVMFASIAHKIMKQLIDFWEITWICCLQASQWFRFSCIFCPTILHYHETWMNIF